MPDRPTRTLVLDGHTRAAVECTQALGRRGEIVDVACAHSNCLAFQSKYTRRKLICDTATYGENFITWLTELDQQEQYQLIIPTSETSLRQMMRFAEENPIRAKAVLASNASLEIALDKDKTQQLASELNIPVPQSRVYYDFSSIGEARQFPLVLKTTHSKVLVDNVFENLSAEIVRDEPGRKSTLMNWLRYSPVQEQAYVSGRGVGVEFLFNRGKRRWHFAHAREHEYPLTGGASTYRRSIAAPNDLLAAGTRILEALQWHGVAMVEFKAANNGNFFLLEINPRLWGSLALALDAHVDFPNGLLQIVRGEPLPDQPRYVVDYFTRDLESDLEWLKESIRSKRSDEYIVTRPTAATPFEYFRPLIGHESWDHFDVHDLRVTASILIAIYKKYVRLILSATKRRALLRRLKRHHAAVIASFDKPSVRPGRILFLCYGNICRSPYATANAAKRMTTFEFRSAGFHRVPGRASPLCIQELARERGVDLTPHRSEAVSSEDIKWAELVVVMDSNNYEMLSSIFPEAVSRTTLLGFFGKRSGPEILDPYALSRSETRDVLNVIDDAISGLERWLTT